LAPGPDHQQQQKQQQLQQQQQQQQQACVKKMFKERCGTIYTVKVKNFGSSCRKLRLFKIIKII
jgi:hypothetical protein